MVMVELVIVGFDWIGISSVSLLQEALIIKKSIARQLKSWF